MTTKATRTNIVVRPVENLEDVRRVAPLFDAYRVFYRQPSDLASSYAFLAERWRSRETVLFLAFVHEVCAGFVHLFPSFVSDRMGHLWILNDIFVDSQYRRCGVGRRLMKRAEEYAVDTGAVGLSLSTAVDNANAQALYRSEGYVRDDEFVVFNRFFEQHSQS